MVRSLVGGDERTIFAKANGDWIRSTPACDGQTLYVGGMRDVLVALNTKDGSEKWRIDFPKEFGSELPTFGFVCSPLIHGEKLYVQAGGSLAAIDRQTGKLLWKSLEDGGGMNGSAFSSPTLQHCMAVNSCWCRHVLHLLALIPKQVANSGIKISKLSAA